MAARRRNFHFTDSRSMKNLFPNPRPSHPFSFFLSLPPLFLLSDSLHLHFAEELRVEIKRSPRQNHKKRSIGKRGPLYIRFLAALGEWRTHLLLAACNQLSFPAQSRLSRKFIGPVIMERSLDFYIHCSVIKCRH